MPKSDYSMMLATRPEPTVLPPSRYQTVVLQCAGVDSSYDLREKSRFSIVSCSFWGFCYHSVITALLNSLQILQKTQASLVQK